MQTLGVSVLVIIVTLAIFGTGYAMAQKAQPAERVSVKTDQVNGRVEIVIDGQPVAVFDATGLNVRHDINYGGVLSDYGDAGFSEHYRKLQVDNVNAR